VLHNRVNSKIYNTHKLKRSIDMTGVKKVLYLGLVCLSLSSLSFGTKSNNLVLNPTFEPDTWWGTGSVLAKRWDRSVGNSAFCSTTTDGYQSSGALYVKSYDVTGTTCFTNSFRAAVQPGVTYDFSFMAKWGNLNAGSIGCVLTSYDTTIPGAPLTSISCTTTGVANSDWVKFSGTYTASANTRALQILLGTLTANTEAWVMFDNVTLKGPDGVNMMIEPGFENIDSTYVTSAIYWRRNTSTAKGAIETTMVHSGTYATFLNTTTDIGMKMFYNAQGANRGYIAIDPNRQYVFGSWMRWSNVNSGAAGIGLQFFNGVDSTINSDSASWGGYTTANGGGDLTLPPTCSVRVVGADTGDWTYVVSTATPPVDARYARMILFSASTTNTGNCLAIFDDVNVKSLPITLTISPSSTSCGIANQQQFTAYQGTAPYTWTSSDTTVGTIDATGLFTGKALGTSIITATDADGYTGTATITVVPTSAPIFREFFE
jgi:hypothetical protein